MAERLNPDTAGRPHTDQGQVADPVRRHGAPVGELGDQYQEQVALRYRRDRRARRRRSKESSSPRAANIGGWSLYAKDGKLKYCYNLLRHPTTLSSSRRNAAPGGQAPGAHGVCVRGRRPGQRAAWPRSLSMASRSAKGLGGHFGAFVFSADDGCDVGEDTGVAVSPDYGAKGNAFNGNGKGVQIAIAEDAASWITWLIPKTPFTWRWRASKAINRPSRVRSVLARMRLDLMSHVQTERDVTPKSRRTPGIRG